MKTRIRKNKKFQDNNYDVEPDNSIEELIQKSLEPQEMPSKPDELISKDLANVLYENRTPEEEEIYNEIDTIYKDNVIFLIFYQEKLYKIHTFISKCLERRVI